MCAICMECPFVCLSERKKVLVISLWPAFFMIIHTRRTLFLLKRSERPRYNSRKIPSLCDRFGPAILTVTERLPKTQDLIEQRLVKVK